MAHFKAKLTQQSFPFNFTEIAGTVLASSYLDQNLQTSAEQAALEAPQAYFMQNVMPVPRGFQSVHYSRVLQPHTYPTYLDEVYVLRDEQGSVALFSPAGGQNLIYTKTTGAWTAFPLPDGILPTAVTVVHLKGVSYVCYAGTGLYQYNFLTQSFEALTIAGLSAADLLGITASNQYLLAYTSQYVAWSNPLDPLDFVPVLGGAGQSAILANRSEIVVCAAVTEGFIVYTTHNAVFGSYSGNPNVPFYFREIPNSAGVSEAEHITRDATAAGHIAWTSSGFMQVSSKGAQLVWPELSSAIADGLYSVQGGADYPVVLTKKSLAVKVSTIGARYYIVSVKDANTGVKDYPVAYVYDSGLDRWGRLDVPHIDFFEYRAPEFSAELTYGMATGAYTYYGSMSYGEARTAEPEKVVAFGATFGCCNSLGAVHIVLGSQVAQLALLESTTSGAAEPKLYLGKYRIRRPNALTWSELQVPLEAQAATFSVIAHDSAGQPIRTLVPVQSSRLASKLVGRVTGEYISIKVQGKFLLTSLEVEAIDAGTRLAPVKASSPLGNLVVVGGAPVTANGDYVTMEVA